MEEVLVVSKEQPEHSRWTTAALEHIQAAEATLYKEKCEFRKMKLKFLGQLIDKKWHSP